MYDLAEAVGNDTEQGLAQLENLYALHMDTCLVCLWMPLLPSLGNSRVLVFRGAPFFKPYSPVRIISIINIAFLLPYHLPRGNPVTQYRPVHLLLGNLSLDQEDT